MKTHSKLFATAVVLATLSRGFGQGTFQNLNFESPVLPLTPDGFFQVPIANALPGWQGYIGINQVGTITYNTISLGAAAISLQGPGSLSPILQGNYSVRLQRQLPSGIPVPALAQTGLIPATAQSIRFFSNGEISVSFAGQDGPLAIIGSGSGYSIFGGDITAFANLSGELRLQGGGTLDNIFFSNQPIPEPSSLVLFGLGAVLCCYRANRLWQK